MTTCNPRVTFLQRPKTTPCKTRLPRIQCLFGECEKVHQAGQNKPDIGYFDSKHFQERVNMRKFLENTKRLRDIKRRDEWYEPRPKATKSGRDPGAPSGDASQNMRKSLPAISLDGINTLVRRPLTTFDKRPGVIENDMEDWCLKPFSTVDHGLFGYGDHFPLLMHKYSQPEEKEVKLKEYHTKRHSIVVADYSHGVIALSGPDDEFQEFVDLFPEKHRFIEETPPSSATDLADHLQKFMNLNATSPSKESLKSSSEDSVLSESSYERLLESYRKSHGERRLTLSDVKASQKAAYFKKGPAVWGRRSSLIPDKTMPTIGKGAWLGGRRSSLVDGPMSLLNADKESLFSSNCSSQRAGSNKRMSFAGPLDLNTVNLLSVIEEAKDCYPVRSETSITDFLVDRIIEDDEDDDDDTDFNENRSEKNIQKLEKFLESLSSDSDSD
ncbi:uncharacterized protein LOC144452532 [Glandiceps talaboti]